MTQRSKRVLLSLAALALAPPLASAQSPATHTGDDVKITLRSGSTVRGRLVNLSSHEVVVRKGSASTRQLLADVTRVETVPHMTRNLAIVGLGAGVIVALASDICGTGEPYGAGQEPACISAKPALYAAGGLAIGALAGAALDRRSRRVLCEHSQSQILLSADLRASRKGLQLTIRW